MSHEISRMYASHEAATNAADALREEGFDEIYVVFGNAGKKTRTSVENFAQQIARSMIHMDDARIYAEVMAKGGSLVTVHAGFGSGVVATEILESFEPIDSGISAPAPEPMWDEATPLSCAMGLPVLLDDPAPFSRMWNIAPLTRSSFHLTESLGMPMMSRNASMGEGRWGLKFLSDNPAPLSSLLGLPVLTKPGREDW